MQREEKQIKQKALKTVFQHENTILNRKQVWNIFFIQRTMRSGTNMFISCKESI